MCSNAFIKQASFIKQANDGTFAVRYQFLLLFLGIIINKLEFLKADFKKVLEKRYKIWFFRQYLGILLLLIRANVAEERQMELQSRRGHTAKAFWERYSRSVIRILGILLDQATHDEGLTTVMCEVLNNFNYSILQNVQNFSLLITPV